MSNQEREALADLVSPADLTPTIRRAIEAGIHRYREERAREDRATFEARQSRAETITRLRTVRTAARRALTALRSLPVRCADDDALIALLDHSLARWTADAAAAADTRVGHRREDLAILTFGVAVVTALAPELEKFEVPIDVGRDTAIVEVLGRLCRLARQLPERTPTSHDYALTRRIIEMYRSTPAGQQFFSRRA